MRLLYSLVLLCAATWTNGIIRIFHGCTTGHITLVDQRGREVEGRSGIVQLCQESTWYTVCGFDGWNSRTANIVCEQLGYLKFFASTMNYTTNTTEENPLSEKTISIRCPIGGFRLTDCQITLQNDSCYYGEGSHQYVYSTVTCSQANCAGGNMRLENGSTNREGRVEVCVDGRWGTVCGEGWGDTEAGLVCARLGLPADKCSEQVYMFGTSSIQPIYNMTCSHIQDNHSNCTPTPARDSCDHSMDLGVRCLTCQDLYITTVEKLRMCESEITSLLSFSTSIASDINSQGASDSRGTTEALGVLTGFLAAVLVVVTMGWIASCICLRKRIKQSKCPSTNGENSINQRQLHNPVYGASIETNLQTNYTSLGHAYEHVEADKETGYDVINRRGAPIPQPSVIPPGSHDPTLSHDYSKLKGNNYHVPESSNMTDEVASGGRVGTRNDQEGRRQNFQLSLHVDDPQEYETPTPTNH